MSGPSTRAVHAGLPPARQGEPFLPGPVLASAYHLSGDDVHATHGYLREGNPTWEAYERALGELEGGDVVLFSSGMAAATAVLLALKPGDRLVAPVDGYYGVRTLAESHLAERGIDVRLVPNEQEALAAAVPGATLILAESPSNPGLETIDVPALRAAAGADAALVVDNTLATPLALRPLELGATLTLASATKALTGHSDLLLGYVATNDAGWLERLRSWRALTGAIPGPLETWLAHRSLATLALRVERQTASARTVVDYLARHDAVERVFYPGLPDHPGHDVHRRQASGDGAVVSFTTGDAEFSRRLAESTELFSLAVSFGSVGSSIGVPCGMSHASVPPALRARLAPPADLVRLSVGIEDVEDLVEDLDRAFALAAERNPRVASMAAPA